MVVTDRDLELLKSLRRYRFLTTALLRDLCITSDDDGRVTRDRLRKLRHEGLVHKLQAEVVNPLTTPCVPVYIPTEKGCCLLASRTGDVRFLLGAQSSTRAWQNLAHYVEVSRLHIAIDRAFQAQRRVQMGDLYFEHDVLNPAANDPAEKYRLYTVITESPRRIFCVPDSAFEIVVGQHRKAYYVELERGTDTPGRVAAKKTPGYAGLQATKKYLQHFPQAVGFAVLVFAPNAGWRDALREAARQHAGHELWRFASSTEVKADTFLSAPIFYTCTEGPFPLIAGAPSLLPASPPGGSPAAERQAEGRS